MILTPLTPLGHTQETDMRLAWPKEHAMDERLTASAWSHAGSNLCLDLHGDPRRSELCVFSDGNHHMALEEALEGFRRARGFGSIFYCTTPPKVYLDWWDAGCLRLGNLAVSASPDLVIGPDDIIEQRLRAGQVSEMGLFAASRGVSMLMRKDYGGGGSDGENGGYSNGDITLLFRADTRLFLSNPDTEKASHAVYRRSIENHAAAAGIAAAEVARLFTERGRIIYGEAIHHREAPQAVAQGKADVAVVYSHLALRYTRVFGDIFARLELPDNGAAVITRYAAGLVAADKPPARELYRHFVDGGAGEAYRRHGLDALV